MTSFQAPYRTSTLAILMLFTVQLSHQLGAADNQSWPCWRGPHFSGYAGDSGHKMVSSFSDARHIWTSTVLVPGTYEGDARQGGDRVLDIMSAGYSSPVVAEGKVFLAYYVPNGTRFCTEALARVVPKKGFGRERWFIDADDIMLCLDAATGKQLWKRSFIQKGYNHEAGFDKGGNQMTPCYADGLIYGLYPSGMLYAMDINTGLPVWTSGLGIRTARQNALRDGLREESVIVGGRNDFGGCPIVCSGILVVSSTHEYKNGPRGMGLGNGLLGLNAKTGKTLWYVEGLGGKGMLASTPMIWRTNGRELVIASGERGVCAMEAKTGKILWTEPELYFDNSAAISGDILVCNKASRLAAVSMSADGCTVLWNHKHLSMGVTSPTIHAGHLYTRMQDRGSSVIGCIELASGKVIKTLKHEATSGSHCGGDGLLFTHASGRGRFGLNIYFMDPSNFRIMDGITQDVSFANSTTAAYVNGRLYLRGRERLLCYDLRSR